MKQCAGDGAEIWLNRARVYEDLPNLQTFMVDNVHLNTRRTQHSCAKALLLCATVEILVCFLCSYYLLGTNVWEKKGRLSNFKISEQSPK